MTTQYINRLHPSNEQQRAFLEAATYICNISAGPASTPDQKKLRVPTDFRQTLQAVEEEFTLLRALKGRLAALLSNQLHEEQSRVTHVRLIFQVIEQTKAVWRIAREIQPIPERTLEQSREIVIPLNIDDCMQKHAAAIAKHKEIIAASESIVKTPIPETHVFDCEGVMAFATVYGYLPEDDDPILASDEFEEIADDFDLIWFGNN